MQKDSFHIILKNKKGFLSTLICFFFLSFFIKTNAQDFYTMNNFGVLYTNTLNGCSLSAPVVTVCDHGIEDIAVNKDTVYYIRADSILYKKTITAPVSACTAVMRFAFGIGSISFNASGILYITANRGPLSSDAGLYTYNPVTRDTTFLGYFHWIFGNPRIEFYKGKLIGFSHDGGNPVQWSLLEINTAQPSSSTVYMNLTYQNLYDDLVSVPKTCDSTEFYINYQSGSGPTHGWKYLKINMANRTEVGAACSFSNAFAAASILPGGSYTRSIIDSIITQPTCTQTNNGGVRVTAHDPGRTLSYILNGVTNTTGVFTGLTPGAYTLTVLNDLNCSKDTSFTIAASTYPSIATTAVNLTSCINNNGQISVRPLNNEVLTYAISHGPYSSIDTFKNLAAGTYIISAMNIPGCVINDTVMLTRPMVNKNGISITTANPVCSQNNGSIQIAVQNNVTPVSFLLNTIASSSGIYQGLQAGQYITTITDGRGCSLDTTLVLTTFPAVHLDSIAIKGNCASQPNSGAVKIFASNSNDVLTYTLNNSSNSTGMFSNLFTGVYATKIVNQYGCYKDTSLQIKQLPSPAFSLKQIQPDCVTKTGTIALNNSTLQYAINGSLFSSVDTIKNLQPGNYLIEAMNAEGCTTSASASIVANNDSVCSSIYFPTGFTPNNDNLNDVFKPAVFGVLEKYQLKIYNRFGQKIFETADYTQGWAGLYKGVPLDAGTFIWYCRYKFYGDKQSEQITKGVIVLLR